MAKAEMSSTHCVVYSACLSGRSYVAKAEMSSARCIVYSACLSGQEDSSFRPYALLLYVFLFLVQASKQAEEKDQHTRELINARNT